MTVVDDSATTLARVILPEPDETTVSEPVDTAFTTFPVALSMETTSPVTRVSHKVIVVQPILLSTVDMLAERASVTTLIVLGSAKSTAPVLPVIVPAFTSDCVACSTLPATVVLAFGVVLVPSLFHVPL
jgi:hypothetical protein